MILFNKYEEDNLLLSYGHFDTLSLNNNMNVTNTYYTSDSDSLLSIDVVNNNNENSSENNYIKLNLIDAKEKWIQSHNNNRNNQHAFL